jgi:hypothetical protein
MERTEFDEEAVKKKERDGGMRPETVILIVASAIAAIICLCVIYATL